MRCLLLQGQQSINPYQLYYTNTNIDPDGIGDNYIAYNKPYGIMSWLQDVNPAGDYFLIVDADMTFHRYFFMYGRVLTLPDLCLQLSDILHLCQVVYHCCQT